MPSEAQRKANKKYQKSEKYKEYAKARYLEKIKQKYIDIASQFFIEYVLANRKYHPREDDFWECIQMCTTGKEIKQICLDIGII